MRGSGKMAGETRIEFPFIKRLNGFVRVEFQIGGQETMGCLIGCFTLI